MPYPDEKPPYSIRIDCFVDTILKMICFRSVLKKHVSKRYMEVPPNCADFQIKQFERLAANSFRASRIEKSREGFFQYSISLY